MSHQRKKIRLGRGFVLRSLQKLEVIFKHHLKSQAEENIFGLEELLNFRELKYRLSLQDFEGFLKFVFSPCIILILRFRI